MNATKNAAPQQRRLPGLTVVLVALPFILLVWLASPMWRKSSVHDASDVSSAARYPYPLAGLPDSRNEIAFYQARQKADPIDASTYSMLARIYLHQAKMTNEPAYFMLAEQAANDSLSHQPFNNDNATMIVARVDEAKHDFRTALSLCQEVLKVKKKQEDALMVEVSCDLGLGRLSDAATTCDALIKAQASLATYAQQALVKEDQGDEAGVETCIREGLSHEEPGDAYGSAWARALFGRYYFRHGRYALARDFYREAIRIMPAFPLGLQQLAEFETATGDYTSADQHYSDAYNIAPSATYLVGKARILALQHNTASASTFQAKAEAMLRRDLTTSPLGHGRDLACLLLTRNQGDDAAQALAILDKDVKNRRDWLTLDAYAWSLQMSHREKDALAVETEALAGGIHSAQLLYRKGELERTLGDTAQADRDQSLAIQYNPEFRTAHAAVPFML